MSTKHLLISFPTLTTTQPVRVVKRCVRRGVASMQVEWEVSECTSLPPDTPRQVTTEEPLCLLTTSLPDLVQQFEDMTLKAKKGTCNCRSNVVNICRHCHKERVVIIVLGTF